MLSQEVKETFVGLLRGINVGGHHKVPMAELKTTLQNNGFGNVQTLLNSGNIIFDAYGETPANLQKTISELLETTFGFPIPTIIRSSKMIRHLLDTDPFKTIEVTKDIRCYASFLGEEVTTHLPCPWISENRSLRIVAIKEQTILSVVDLSKGGTVEAMKVLENQYGKDIITTRNWKTMERIGEKLTPEH